jgi:hypothetical protein
MREVIEWRAVGGWEGFYEVSSSGQVRSLPRMVASSSGRLRRCPARILKPWLNGNGYPCVTLCRSGFELPRRIHRLVAHAFIHRESADLQVNHKDGNRQNCTVPNLEWVTARGNLLHAYHQLGSIRVPDNTGDRGPKAKLTNAQAREIARRCALGEGTGDLAREFEVAAQTISSLKHGYAWSSVTGIARRERVKGVKP